MEDEKEKWNSFCPPLLKFSFPFLRPSFHPPLLLSNLPSSTRTPDLPTAILPSFHTCYLPSSLPSLPSYLSSIPAFYLLYNLSYSFHPAFLPTYPTLHPAFLPSCLGLFLLEPACFFLVCDCFVIVVVSQCAEASWCHSHPPRGTAQRGRSSGGADVNHFTPC